MATIIFLVLEETKYKYSGDITLNLEDTTLTLQEAEAIKDEKTLYQSVKEEADRKVYHIQRFDRD